VLEKPDLMGSVTNLGLVDISRVGVFEILLLWIMGMFRIRILPDKAFITLRTVKMEEKRKLKQLQKILEKYFRELILSTRR
jgi:hypothetical protein